MKRFFKALIFLLMVLVFVLAYFYMGFKSVQPKAFSEGAPEIPESAAQHLSKAVQFKTVSHKIEMMDNGAMTGPDN